MRHSLRRTPKRPFGVSLFLNFFPASFNKVVVSLWFRLDRPYHPLPLSFMLNVFGLAGTKYVCGGHNFES